MGGGSARADCCVTNVSLQRPSAVAGPLSCSFCMIFTAVPSGDPERGEGEGYGVLSFSWCRCATSTGTLGWAFSMFTGTRDCGGNKCLRQSTG